MNQPRKPRPDQRRQPPRREAAAPTKPAHPSFPCPVYDRCGGCQLAHLTYAEQLQRKQQAMEKLLGHLCGVSPILGMEEPLHYRGKVHAVIAENRRGEVISGV